MTAMSEARLNNMTRYSFMPGAVGPLNRCQPQPWSTQDTDEQ